LHSPYATSIRIFIQHTSTSAPTLSQEGGLVDRFPNNICIEFGPSVSAREYAAWCRTKNLAQIHASTIRYVRVIQ
jgi:hypothetical protein